MDQIQTVLKDMILHHPDCISSRSKMKALLFDYLPSNRRECNLLLSAFDEDVVPKLNDHADPALSAMRVVKLLKDDHGLTGDAATWAVQTWCYLLNADNIANALEVFHSSTPSSPSTTAVVTDKLTSEEYQIGLGIHRAGTDFPAGDLSFELKGRTKEPIFYGVGDTPNKIETFENSFKTKTYARMEEGQYIKMETDEERALTFIVRKVK